VDTKALVEERIKLFEENKVLLDKGGAEKRTLTAEEQQEYDKRDARIREIRGTLDRVALQDAEERSLAESRGRKTETKVSVNVEVTNTRAQDEALAFRAWACGEYATPEMVDAAERIGMRHNRRELETRALSIGVTTGGGNSVVNEIQRGFFEAE
jgi:HK97 family phage major capsid protein